MTPGLIDERAVGAKDYAWDMMVSEAKMYAKAKPSAGGRTIYKDGNFIKGWTGRLAGRWVTKNGDFFPTRRLAVSDAQAFKRDCVEYLTKEGAI
jgi:hypothetical protein